MGRPPKPIADLKKQGTYRKDRHDRPQVPAEPIDGLPDMPAHLPDACLADWQRVCGILTEMKILSTSDLDAVGRYVLLLWMNKSATAELEATGPVITYETRHGKTSKPNPAARVVLDTAKELRALGSQLGFDPASRQRLNLEKLGGKEDKKPSLVDFMKGGRFAAERRWRELVTKSGRTPAEEKEAADLQARWGFDPADIFN